jgi:hypothetical protein
VQRAGTGDYVVSLYIRFMRCDVPGAIPERSAAKKYPDATTCDKFKLTVIYITELSPELFQSVRCGR